MKRKMMGFAAALALLLQMMAVPVGAADGQIYEAEDAVMRVHLKPFPNPMHRADR
ncbi:MAG: hypothetical protein IJ265_07630 [Oscillospiraceae bacterium]|nr:hypothetical protein [Oscillospiraceae bacterium]